LEEFFLFFYRSALLNLPTTIGYNGWFPGVEANLDIQYLMSIGAQIPTYFWSVKDPSNPNDNPFLKWLLEVDVTDPAPWLFSVIYGEDEVDLGPTYARRISLEFAKQAIRGISVLFASGDSGVGGPGTNCNAFVPDFPATSPYVTSVGGTALETSVEVAAGLSGGGFSNFFKRPNWQNTAVNTYLSTMKSQLPAQNLWNNTGRAYPDISALSENYVIVDNLLPIYVAGTSCSTPVVSGTFALLNDLRFQAGKRSLGYLNPLLYKLAATSPQVFSDIVIGSNPGCNTLGFPATKGWDPVTGVGAPIYSKLASVVLQLP